MYCPKCGAKLLQAGTCYNCATVNWAAPKPPSLTGRIDVIVMGGAGPTGKTTVQMVIARALEDAGYAVKCFDECNGIDDEKDFKRMVAKYHQERPRRFFPQEVRVNTQIRER